jgi:hypothetical protein
MFSVVSLGDPEERRERREDRRTVRTKRVQVSGDGRRDLGLYQIFSIIILIF